MKMFHLLSLTFMFACSDCQQGNLALMKHHSVAYPNFARVSYLSRLSRLVFFFYFGGGGGGVDQSDIMF